MNVRRRERAAWATVLCAVGLSFFERGPARADTPPNAWDIARDPAIVDRWTLHVRIERLLEPTRRDDCTLPESRQDVELRLEAARAMLEQAEASQSPDVRLRFDLGLVYYRLGDCEGDRNDLFDKAVEVLVPALDAAPDHPAATEAWAGLVYAYAKLNRPRQELSAWRQYIPRLLDDHARITPMMNMGEAQMRLGDVDGALGTFREVLRLCGDLPNTTSVSQTYVLGLWDVAIALDRSGDPEGALETASQARRIHVLGYGGLPVPGSTLIASDPHVFFVPSWERQWYLALDSTAAARDARDGPAAAEWWGQAEKHWAAYVDRSAAAGGDPFLPIARVRLARAHERFLAAVKAAARLPRRATEDGPR